MKTLEESVIIAMDGSDIELFPFLPYILQDHWEFGADPDAVIKLIKKHCTNYADLKVLDLGCGKGAISVKAANALGCNCLGIDAIPEFIDFAKIKAKEYQVEHLCRFETGDIRLKIKEISGYDIIVLGAIGPVFGDYYTTLTTLSGCMHKNGIFIIDDGYILDDSNYSHPLIQKQSTILKQIDSAGMRLIEDDIIKQENIKNADDSIFENIKKRCHELIDKYPDKKKLFTNYIQRQIEENDVLENNIICTTMVIMKNLRI